MNDLQVLESALTPPESRMLPMAMPCPDCKAVLELALGERLDRRFTCPECNATVDMTTMTSIVKDNMPENVHTPTPCYAMSIAKLVVMTVFTFGLYQLYWFYRNWRAIKAGSGEEISPFWRAFFAPLFCYDLFERVKDMAISSGVRVGYSSGLLAGLFILARIAGRFPGSWALLGLAGLFVLIPVQKTINDFCAQRGDVPSVDSRYSGTNIIGIVLGGLILAFGLLRDSLPDSRHENVQVRKGSYVSTMVAGRHVA